MSIEPPLSPADRDGWFITRHGKRVQLVEVDNADGSPFIFRGRLSALHPQRLFEFRTDKHGGPRWSEQIIARVTGEKSEETE
jgi:hypothetical protein